MSNAIGMTRNHWWCGEYQGSTGVKNTRSQSIEAAFESTRPRHDLDCKIPKVEPILNVRDERRLHGVSKAAMARLVGVSLEKWCKYEDGTTPLPLHVFYKLEMLSQKKQFDTGISTSPKGRAAPYHVDFQIFEDFINLDEYSRKIFCEIVKTFNQ